MLYLAAVGIVLGVNLLPAFGPPTWALLVLFKLNWHLNPVALVILGACAAGSGRYLLARVCYRLRGRLSQRRRDNLAAAQTYLTGHRGGAILGLGLFALSPLPSAQLFEAAGVLGLPLLPLTGAFFAGRLVSYSLYIGAAAVAQRTYGGLLTSALTSPLGIATQVVMLLAIIGLTQINWRRLPYIRRPQQRSD
jgi:membrane protein YqaA with SNARE-associated domain